MADLYTKTRIEEDRFLLAEWKWDAFQSFKQMIADNENTYPCLPGRHGFLSDQLRYAFLDDPRKKETMKDIAEVLREYGPLSRDTGAYASLVLFFKTGEELQKAYSVEQFEDLFWSILSGVRLEDKIPWPDGIAEDPDDHTWEFCFQGEPYFAFCATPAHRMRKSRCFPFFLVAFQPRWVFENMNDETSLGRNMKKMIRKRLENYDEVPPHPALKWYGQEDNHEWKQYFLRENASSPTKCPFLNMVKARGKD